MLCVVDWSPNSKTITFSNEYQSPHRLSKKFNSDLHMSVNNRHLNP